MHCQPIRPLKQPAYFKQFKLDDDLMTLTWPNGADFAPDFLYHYEAEALPVDLRR